MSFFYSRSLVLRFCVSVFLAASCAEHTYDGEVLWGGEREVRSSDGINSWALMEGESVDHVVRCLGNTGWCHESENGELRPVAINLFPTEQRDVALRHLRAIRGPCVIQNAHRVGDDEQIGTLLMSLMRRYPIGVTLAADRVDAAEVADFVARFPDIRAIWFSRGTFTPITREYLESIAHLTHLESLVFAMEEGTDPDVYNDDALQLIESLVSLKYLMIKGHFDGRGFRFLRDMQALEELWVWPSDLSNETRQPTLTHGFEHLARLPSLRILVAHEGTAVDDEDLVQLSESESIEQLSVSEAVVTDASMPALARMSQLRQLRLRWNSGITNEGAVHLLSLTNLEYLDLGSTEVTSEVTLMFPDHVDVSPRPDR